MQACLHACVCVCVCVCVYAGKDTVCHLTVARASRVTLPATCSHDIQGKHAGTEALCIELVADRFLRK